MRVALLTANARAGDAIGNQVAEKVAFFRERGADVRVFLQDGRFLHPAVRPVASVASGPGQDAGSRLFLASADLVLAEYSQHYPLLAWLPGVAAGRQRVILDYHGVTPPELWHGTCPEAVSQGWRHRRVVWQADAALVHSRFAQAELCASTGFSLEHTHLLGYPLDQQQFHPAAPQRDLRRRLRLGTATLLLFVGRLAPNKRPDLLVEAVARLAARTPAVHAVLIGDSTDRYQVEAERCRQRAADLGVSDRVHLLGRVTEDQLLDAYRSADVLVMPSVHEGFCLPVIEAFACGLTVVAARAGALPETVGDAGLLFAPATTDDLVSQLEVLLGESAEAKASRQRRGLARAAAFARPCWQAQFGSIMEHILDAPARSRGPRPAAAVHEVLAEAATCRQLPDDYLDVTEGWGASLKRRLKRKLLGNFKQAYVDVLSRQQSAFNQHLLTAVTELFQLHSQRTAGGEQAALLRIEETLSLVELQRTVEGMRRTLEEMETRLRDLEAERDAGLVKGAAPQRADSWP